MTICGEYYCKVREELEILWLPLSLLGQLSPLNQLFLLSHCCNKNKHNYNFKALVTNSTNHKFAISVTEQNAQNTVSTPTEQKKNLLFEDNMQLTA